MNIIIFLLLISIIATQRGFILKSFTGNFSVKQKAWYQTIWHFLDGLSRIFIALIITTNLFTLITLVAIIQAIGLLLFHWMLFDGIMNYVRFRKLFYDANTNTGTGSIIDKLLNGKLYYISQIIALISGLFISIFPQLTIDIIVCIFTEIGFFINNLINIIIFIIKYIF